jgi:hypothetical protein
VQDLLVVISIIWLIVKPLFLPIFLVRFGFLFVVWVVALTFLGCWALITVALVTHFL